MTDDHRWLIDSGALPPFATGSEIEREYQRYLESVTEEQFHGLRFGESEAEVLVFDERPGVSIRLDADPSSWEPYEWTPGVGGTIRLARRMLAIATGDTDGELVDAFAEKIVSRLSRHEWTLTYDFIRSWAQLMKENRP